MTNTKSHAYSTRFVRTPNPIVNARNCRHSRASSGGLVGSGIPEHEARFYSDAVERGGILLGVRTDNDRSSVVQELLRHNGGESISVR